MVLKILGKRYFVSVSAPFSDGDVRHERTTNFFSPLDDLSFCLNCNICSFPDDTTPYACDTCLDDVLQKLERV